MFTTIGFHLAATTKGAVYETIPSVPDQSMSFNQAGQFLLPTDMKTIAALVMGPNISAARLNMPWLRNVLLPELYPISIGAVLPSNPSFIYYGDAGFTLRKTEGLTLEASDDGTGAVTATGTISLSAGMTPAPGGPVYTMRALVNGASGLTTVAGVWTFGGLTFAQTLPAGTYAVVGLQVSDTESVCARLVFPACSYTRPGVFPQATYGDTYAPQIYRYGRLGEWGRFVQTAIPGIEFLGFAGAAENPNVFLDLVKVSDQMGPVVFPNY